MYMLKLLQNKIIKFNKDFIIYNQPYTFFKKDYKSIIPLNIYQTWATKDLPQKMRERVELLKHQNPRFNHHLFDDNDCREFIKTHFKPDVLYAYVFIYVYIYVDRKFLIQIRKEYIYI